MVEGEAVEAAAGAVDQAAGRFRQNNPQLPIRHDAGEPERSGHRGADGEPMQLVIEILGLGLLLPAFLAAAVYGLARWRLPSSIANRYAAALGLAGAYLAGYALLPQWAALWPERHWHWVPYVALLGLLGGPLSLAAGVSLAERWLLHLLLALLAAWVLVPTWAALQPQRTLYVTGLAGGLFLLWVLLDPLASRIRAPQLLWLLAAVSFCLTIVLAHSSMVFAQLGGIATGALVGCASVSPWHNTPNASRGLLTVFVLLVGGLTFVGFIEPDPPLVNLLALPVTPLALWCTVRGPLARPAGRSQTAVRSAVVLIPLLLTTAAILWLRQTAAEPY